MPIARLRSFRASRATFAYWAMRRSIVPAREQARAVQSIHASTMCRAHRDSIEARRTAGFDERRCAIATAPRRAAPRRAAVRHAFPLIRSTDDPACKPPFDDDRRPRISPRAEPVQTQAPARTRAAQGARIRDRAHRERKGSGDTRALATSTAGCCRLPKTGIAGAAPQKKKSPASPRTCGACSAISGGDGDCLRLSFQFTEHHATSSITLIHLHFSSLHVYHCPLKSRIRTYVRTYVEN